MSYIQQNIYQILPTDSFPVLRKCAGCGCKTTFHNTNCFRVNANGNQLDVWLIYQCESCKHTWNLTIYERKRPNQISKQEYDQFMKNSRNLAMAYGTNVSVFAQNKAEIDWNQVAYQIQNLENSKVEENQKKENEMEFLVENPYYLKFRWERIISEQSGLSRKKLKQMEKEGQILVIEENFNHRVRVRMKGFL